MADRKRLIPVGQDLLSFLHLFLRTGEIEFHFAGASSNQDSDGRQSTTLHAQVELSVGFFGSMALKAMHGSASRGGQRKATVNAKNRTANGREWTRSGDE